MITADYEFYLTEYYGTASEGEFNRMGVMAQAYLEEITSERVLEELSVVLQRKVNLAYCKLVDTYLLNESGGGVVSATNDGISETYRSMYSSTKSTDDTRLYSTVRLLLGGTGLLYRGVR